jgi:hypothetical protein
MVMNDTLLSDGAEGNYFFYGKNELPYGFE